MATYKKTAKEKGQLLYEEAVKSGRVLNQGVNPLTGKKGTGQAIATPTGLQKITKTNAQGLPVGGTRSAPGAITADQMTPTSYEDIGKIQQENDYQATLDAAQELGLGEDAPTKMDEYIKMKVEAKKRQDASQNLALEGQRMDLRSQGQSIRSQSDYGQAMAASGLAGPQTNTALAGGYQQAAQAQLARLKIDDQRLAMYAEDLKAAQASGDLELAQSIQAERDAYTNQAMANEAAYVQALGDYEKTKAAVTQSNLSSFQSLVDEGQELSVEAISGFAGQLGIPFEDAYGYYAGVQSIRDDKTLSLEEKELAIAQSKQDLQDQINGVTTAATQNLEYLKKMYQSGASAEDISAFKSAAGIADYEDPATIADLNYKNAQTAYMESQTAENFQALLTAKAEYEDVYGSGVFLPSDSKYAVTPSADGSISVAVSDGQILDNPNTERREDYCGAFVNDVLGIGIGSYNKSDMINSDVPAPGMAFVQLTSDDYDHTGIVESVDLAAGTMEVVEANWKKGDDGKGIISRRTMYISDAEGFIKPQNSVPTSGNKYSYDSYLSQAKSIGLQGADAKEWAKDMATQAYTGFKNTDQSKAYYQYEKMIPEQVSYQKTVEGMTDAELEEFADVNGFLAKKLISYDADSQLTAQIINDLVSDPTQRQLILNQARWLGAKLRGESGAAISVGEYLTEGQQFWPQKGDDAQTVKDKSAARDNITNGLYDIMGPYGQRLIDESKADQSAVNEEDSQVEAAISAAEAAIKNQDASDYWDNGSTTTQTAPQPTSKWQQGLYSFTNK